MTITINTGNGNNTIYSEIKKTSIKEGNGNNVNYLGGKGSSVNAGDGDNDVVFNADNITIELGDGDNSVNTLDQAIKQGKYTERADEVDYTTIEKTVSKGDGKQSLTNAEILKCLPAEEQKMAESIDWEAKCGQYPVYMIQKAPDNKYHIYEFNGANNYKAVSNNVCKGSNYFSLTGDTTVFGKLEYTTESEKYTIKETSATQLQNITIKAGSGKNNGTVNADNDTLNLNQGSNSNIQVISAQNSSSGEGATNDTTTKTILSGGASYWRSPLVVDYNQDGKVSAKAGIGVDIDNDGIADGAAVDGDKMLAMSDINKNGKIDGAEVFGDNTIDPFTKQKINAPNGFEALKQIATSAEKYTGIKCYTNGNVDLQSLKIALTYVGVDLGLISGSNDKSLENLGELKSINVNTYTNDTNVQNARDGVWHAQSGSATLNDGTAVKTDDVWFACSSVAANSAVTLSKKLNNIYKNR